MIKFAFHCYLFIWLKWKLNKLQNETFQEDKIKIGKYVISYVKVGNGPIKLFCAPGALSTKWKDFKPILQEFKRDMFSIVAWDPPGYGKSYPPARDFADGFLEKDADLAHELMKVWAK